MAAGNTSFDIRLIYQFEEPVLSKTHAMIAINSKFTNSDQYFEAKTLDDIKSTTHHLRKHYPKYLVVPVMITNFAISHSLLEKYGKDIIIYHSGNIHHFFPSLWNRIKLDGQVSNPVTGLGIKMDTFISKSHAMI
ncbi:hypothetical protein DFA_01525 [Cavenderia fasciculata]|uniref:Uncharacterized protein n=1 Tax=Cavenderia fasciculata TaxID=261658 RepID=F4PTB7_CACFS|nr:uncharacterized protein DFA_01525 [Cavenderia fasciculata]EGG21639.1 hypothetical protein DFA_01525 [Cavenderia fasciculata]|eukprot:XP_004359489.1 hypothetical protein DFA_01525 [Cavenderia fasciculata]